MNRAAPVVDWHALIDELRKSYGMTRLDIASDVDLHVDTLRTYLSGIARPSHQGGEALIALWMRITQKPREQIPTECMPLSVGRLKHR